MKHPSKSIERGYKPVVARSWGAGRMQRLLMGTAPLWAHEMT